MNRIMPRTVRNGGTPSPTNGFSEEEIERFNWEHDLRNGFSFEFPTVFFNPRRLPETFCGPISELWNRPLTASAK